MAALHASDSATRSRIRTSTESLVGHPVAPVLVLGALLLADAALLVSLQRDMTFLVDEWLLLTERREWDLETFLSPFYEHLFLIPVAVFKVLMLSTGIGPHMLYAIPLIVLHLTCVVLVYALARPRIGAWFALAPATSILFLGSSYDNMLLPIQISFLGSIAAGLGMLLALDSGASRRAEGLACGLLALSLASSSVGVVFAIAAFVEIVPRRPLRRHIWVALVPLALYGVWLVVYGPRGLQQGSSVRSNLPDVPAHAADAAAAVFGALAGLDLVWGRTLVTLAAICVIYRLMTRGLVSARFAGILVAAICFWLLGGLARAHQDNPEAARYLYPGAVFVVLLGVEALRSARLDRRWAVLLVSGVAFGVLGNADPLRDARDTHRAFSREVSAQFAALEVMGRKNVPPDLVAAPYLAPGVSARSYFDMTDDLGSPVDVNRDIVERGEDERRDADIVLAAALRGLRVRNATVDTGARPPAVEQSLLGTAATSGACVRFESSDVGGAATVIVDGGALVRASSAGSVDVSLRRFGTRFRRIGRIAAGSSLALPLPSGIETPWRLRVEPRGSVDICSTRAEF